MEIIAVAILLFSLLFFIIIMVVIGQLKLSKITNKSPLLAFEFSRERYEISDKLKSGLKSIKFELMNQKQSELTKIHTKLRDSELNDSNLNIFAPDTQQIMFEMADYTSDEFHSDITSNTDTFSEFETNPIPITMRISADK